MTAERRHLFYPLHTAVAWGAPQRHGVVVPNRRERRYGGPFVASDEWQRDRTSKRQKARAARDGDSIEPVERES